MGPEMPESGSKTSTVPVVWTNFEFFRRDPNDFLSLFVTMDKPLLYHYDPETKQQLIEWRHSGLPCPKIFQVQKSAGKILASMFGDQDGILLIDYLPKSQTINPEYYSSLLVWCNWRTFWRKNAAGRSPRGPVLARQCPGSPGTCNPEETGLPGLPMSWSSTLFSGSGPFGLPPVSWTEYQLQGRHFSSDAEVIATAETWLDGQPSVLFFFFFFWVAWKRYSNGLRSVLSFVGSVLNKSRVWSL